MKLLHLGIVCVLGIAVAACSSSNMPTGVTAGSATQAHGAVHISNLRGWISPDAKKQKLLYVSDAFVEIYSVPKYSLVGQITEGINEPDGLAVDKHGNLYVANYVGRTVTIYRPGETSPSLTLTEPDYPVDVAVGSNGYVYACDLKGGVDVYQPGATSPIRRLTNPDLAGGVLGVAVDSSNDVYAAGETAYYSAPAVVEFAKARGPGKNLRLTGLFEPTGVIVEDKYLIVSDVYEGLILTYAPGQTSPSSTFTAPYPERSVINKAENVIYVPEHYYTPRQVGVYDYPSGTLVTTVSVGGYPGGAALSPAHVPAEDRRTDGISFGHELVTHE